MIPNTPGRKPAVQLAGNEWEQAIDAALHSLSLAQPAPGMQERLKTRVPVLAAHRLPARASQNRKWVPASFGALATLACVCLLLVLLRHVYRSQVPVVPPAQVPAAHPQTGNTAPQPSSNVSAPIPVQVFHLALTTRPAPQQAHLQAPSSTQGPALPTQAQLDAQALADTNAPSHPVPNLELTAQERQATLMVRRGEKRNVASLDPAYQAFRAKQVQTDFQSFLHPTPTPFEQQVERDAARVQAGLSLINPDASQSIPQLTTGDRK